MHAGLVLPYDIQALSIKYAWTLEMKINFGNVLSLFLPSLSLWMFKYAFICLCVKQWIHYFIYAVMVFHSTTCEGSSSGGVEMLILFERGATRKKHLRTKTHNEESKFPEKFMHKLALSSYHSWIFRTIKWENIKLNYACMKRWKSAVGHCSFSSVFCVLHDHLSSLLLLPRRPSDCRLEHVCGCWNIAVRTAPP